jgi:iron(III) transport system ATP-binding protein
LAPEVDALDLRSVYKSYGDQAVLCALDLSVEHGSFTSVLGPSGSGKTTLLRVIAGFERVDRGEVTINGLLVDDGRRCVTPDRRRIGYVPQEGSLFPHLTVAQNVGFGLDRAARRAHVVTSYLEMVDLAGFGDRYPHQLSGGQQQRVALARALATKPALVLMDEPFSSLDATLRATVRADVRRVLRAAGTTALLVTHDQDEAISLADRVAVLRDGKIGQVATPEQMYESPASPELARSLGETNFVAGTALPAGVETDLGVLALANGPFAPGTKLRVLVRPEQLQTEPERVEGPGATVTEREFYGHDIVLRLSPTFDRANVLIARSADVPSAAPVGATVALSVRGSVIAWPEAGARGVA